MELKPTLKELNEGLKIVVVKTSHGREYCFKNNLGFVAFENDFRKDPVPYIPCGGKKALKAILEGGGFCGTENMIIVSENEYFKEIA